MRSKGIAIGLLLLIGQVSCSDDSADFVLEGTWIDSESLGLQFIEFHSDKRGRFGFYSKDHERFDHFKYRLFENKIAIDFEGDAAEETVHEIKFDGKNKIEISGLTDIPENPARIYLRQRIIIEKESNDVTLGINDVYFDFENGYRIQARPSGESRCPTGAICVWAGYASAQVILVVNGNIETTFDLSTIDLGPHLRRDTLIDGITYTLKDITPYPDLSRESEPEDYKVILTVEK